MGNVVLLVAVAFPLPVCRVVEHISEPARQRMDGHLPEGCDDAQGGSR